MKIVIQDNFDRDYFTERVIAENVDPYIGKELVEEWNNKNWKGDSQYYLALVEVLYDGYADL